MKSAYELAMERLQKQAPSVKLTDDQKAKIAELESRYKARVAEREIALADAIATAAAQGNFDEIRNLEQQLALEKKRLPKNWRRKRKLCAPARPDELQPLAPAPFEFRAGSYLKIFGSHIVMPGM